MHSYENKSEIRARLPVGFAWDRNQIIRSSDGSHLSSAPLADRQCSLTQVSRRRLRRFARSCSRSWRRYFKSSTQELQRQMRRRSRWIRPSKHSGGKSASALWRPGPGRLGAAPLAFSYGNPFCMALLYGRAGRLTAETAVSGRAVKPAPWRSSSATSCATP
jgi:hypothetical protein